VSNEWLLGYTAGRLSVIGPWKKRKDNVLVEFDKLAGMLLVANSMLMRVRAVCDDHAKRHPDPGGQPCDAHCPQQIIADLKEALDG
jgi:hypothetical protein